ncbi:hypothetical protein OIU77_028888 [Salix suchowensis]|uniref:DUF382 domain-containing protein n=1 Tax=Salix suchowensis TaxID=1278906 RepID=A0ABQ9BJC7_9ROSI|nr:hypothetical protein OIU77_028888 [Salix suchowensis]
MSSRLSPLSVPFTKQRSRLPSRKSSPAVILWLIEGFVRDRVSLTKSLQKKKVCSRPDVVEVWDATSADPKLLVFLKSYKNTVPVPRHWCQKRKFLQGKRGIEKQPFHFSAS